MTNRQRLCVATLALGVAMFIACIVFTFIGIWTHDPDLQRRSAGTAMALAIIGAIVVGAGAIGGGWG